MTRTRFVIGVLALSGVLGSGSGPTAARADEWGCTLPALQLAYGREMDSREAYLAYAAEADARGYCGVASLFRAVAAAEGIHAKCLANALEWRGVKPAWQPGPIHVGTTAENLRAAAEGECFEFGHAYGPFVEIARRENHYDCAWMLGNMRHAEETHATLFGCARYEMEQMLEDPVYYACTCCGCVSEKPCAGRCNCGAAGRDFLAVH